MNLRRKAVEKRGKSEVTLSDSAAISGDLIERTTETLETCLPRTERLAARTIASSP